jgi:dTDP-glucose pyrophosphorylase
MGLLRFSATGQKIVADYVKSLSPEKADKLDMTSLLRALLARGANIGAVPVSGGWCECDTENDITLYEEKLAAGTWSHDWR